MLGIFCCCPKFLPKFFIGGISVEQLCYLVNYFVVVYRNENGQAINSLKFYPEMQYFVNRFNDFFCYTKSFLL